MKDTNIQWHPGFVAAMHLELRKDRENLIFQKEYNLNTKPLAIDLLIIQKNSTAALSNEIGKLFRGYNVMEYKSPGNSMDIDVYYKTMAYAALYKANGQTSDSIKAEDITISLVREARPRKLFQHFKRKGCSITEPYAGIYYVEGAIPFPTQILVTQELEPSDHAWLRALSRKVTEPDAQKLLQLTKNLTETGERNFADSVLTVMLKANRQMFEHWKGAENMFDILLELMEPQIEAMLKDEREKAILIGEQRGEQRGIRIGEQNGIRIGKQDGIRIGEQNGIRIGEQNGIRIGEQNGIRIGEQNGIRIGKQIGKIQGAIDILQDLGYSNAEIKADIIKKYNLSPTEADNYLSENITTD